ncbi:MAG: putative quinol monooxygenase [Kordia sp.]
MKSKIPLKLMILVVLLGISTQIFSKPKNSNDMNDKKNETVGLVVIMKAKANKVEEVKNFLRNALVLVNEEVQTVSWFAFQIDEQTFGIYDAFEVESGRQAHLKGKVAEALLANAGNLLENFDPAKDIQLVSVIAANHTPGIQNKGLFVTMKAKPGKAATVENFLHAGKELVGEEVKTLSWYAIKIDENTYAIFDTFTNDEGRNAHLTGKVAAALMKNAPVILDDFEASHIQKIDVLASK